MRTNDNLSKPLKTTPQELHLSRKWALSFDLTRGSARKPCAPTCNSMHFYGPSTQKISEDFQQCLEDQLQGAIETCGQLDHVQKFITWASTHHCRGPVLFSRALVRWQDSPQMSHCSPHRTVRKTLTIATGSNFFLSFILKRKKSLTTHWRLDQYTKVIKVAAHFKQEAGVMNGACGIWNILRDRSRRQKDKLYDQTSSFQYFLKLHLIKNTSDIPLSRWIITL